MFFLKLFKFVFLSLTCALILAACSGGNTPDGVAQDFFKAMVSGETDKVISLMDVPSDQAKELDEMRPKLDSMLKAMKKQIDSQGGVKSVSVVSTKLSEDGNSAEVVLKVEMKNGQSPELPTFSLKKVDGKWKVID